MEQWRSTPHIELPVDTLPLKQSFWDRPFMTSDRQLIEDMQFESERIRHTGSLSTVYSRLACRAPVSSCGLRLDNEAVRVAVALSLGLFLALNVLTKVKPINQIFSCQCGAEVDARCLHGLICMQGSSDITFIEL